jgi:VWFA-related protein
LLAFALSAQNSSEPAGPGAATFRAATHQVLIDVVVTDHSGHFLPNLKPADFTILEDGKPQKVVAFAMHAASLAPPKPAARYTLPPNQYTNYSVADPEKPITIVLMDVLNTVVQDQAYAHKQMIEFLKALPGGQRVALFALGTRLRMVHKLFLRRKFIRHTPSVTVVTSLQSPLDVTCCGSSLLEHRYALQSFERRCLWSRCQHH